MKADLTQAFVHSLDAANLDVYDTQQPGLVLRTRASGRHSYRVLLGHGRWYKFGSTTVLTPAAARELARQVLGDLAHGMDPPEKKRKAAAATFYTFLKLHYERWALTHLRSASSFLRRLRAALAARDEERRQGRVNANGWRRGRGYVAALRQSIADYLKVTLPPETQTSDAE